METPSEQEMQPATPEDMKVYQAIADNYFKDAAEKSAPVGTMVFEPHVVHELFQGSFDPGFYGRMAARKCQELRKIRTASEKVGAWLSAALEDPKVCDEMKADVNEWFEAVFPVAEKSAPPSDTPEGYEP
jgi:hypothetical protein